MERIATLEVHQDQFSFSAGHFTIFSAEEREQLHGHNYGVGVIFKFSISHNGLAFDYRYYKKKMKTLCAQLDRKFLLPNCSPYLTLERQDDYYIAHFNHKKLFFLTEDVVILPIANTTIEELSHWLLQQLLEQSGTFKEHSIHEVTVKVFNGPGQSAAAHWHS